MIDAVKKTLNEQMEKVISGLSQKLLKVRTGRASAHVLDPVQVDYYGTPTPLKQVGQVSTPEARLLQIQPFDKSLLPIIEKAILSANLGLTPSNDGNLIRIPFPPLNEDTRKGIVKDLKKISEETKVLVRNLRRDQNEVIKKAEKDKKISEDENKKFQTEVQNITDKYISKIDDLVAAKEKEVMTV